MPDTILDPSALTYDERGLIPAILQDSTSKKVLMLGYMNEETLSRTLEIGQAIFWSRSRGEQWHKGGTSGDYVRVLGVETDCDSDALLLSVELLGSGICHTGARSCFVDADGEGLRIVRV